ncbi:NADH:flavin oxidoreductase, partial [candidate division MSBL1 archaeon SCGC-AAA259E22]
INEKNSRRAMSKQDIKELIELFADASKRGKEANFDGIQLHMAHGYLFSQFLSPLFNQRRDEYGGDIESRAKFPVEVLKGIRKNVGPDFPVLAKLNCRDYHEKGLSLEESIQVGKFLEEAGLDAIELSGGLLINEDLNPSRKNITSEKDEAYFEEEAKIFKAEIDIPLMLVGGIRSYSVAKRIISENTADYVSMSRPLIREPNLIKRWHAGDHRKATCTSCNECFKAGYSQKVFCPIENRQNISN